MPTRRHFLALSAGAVLPAFIPAAISTAQAQTARIGSVRVEFSPIVVEGWGNNLSLVRAELEKTLAEILGAGIQRGGNQLVISVSSLWLGSAVGGSGRRRGDGSGGDNDYLESTATLYDPAGRQLASWPIRSTENGNGIPWYLPDANQLRLKALARNNAWWIKHYLA